MENWIILAGLVVLGAVSIVIGLIFVLGDQIRDYVQWRVNRAKRPSHQGEAETGAEVSGFTVHAPRRGHSRPVEQRIYRAKQRADRQESATSPNRVPSADQQIVLLYKINRKLTAVNIVATLVLISWIAGCILSAIGFYLGTNILMEFFDYLDGLRESGL
jgi:hypothetical protein